MIVGMLLYSFIINYWLKWRFRGGQGLGIMARGKRKRDKRWMWVVKPGDKIVVSRTAVIPSKKLSRRDFKVLEEILNIYSRMLENVLPHASRNIIESYYRLKNEKYHELRSMYPNIPSHYIHGVCQDAVERISSLRRNRARQYSREIFDELVKYLNLGKRDLRGRRIVRYLWRRSWEIAWDHVDLEMMGGILGRGSTVLASGWLMTACGNQ